MSKTNATVNDAQLKGRRTSLEKKSYDELINIILRKDATERKNNSKIQTLLTLLKEADELNEEKATRISNFDKDMQGMQDKVNTFVEINDNLMRANKELKDTVDTQLKRIVALKDRNSLLRKGFFVLLGISALIILLVLIF